MKCVQRLCLQLGVCGVLAASISAALAQEAPEVTEVVIVTGSLIRGSSEETALPIDVISAEDLEKSGTPSMLDVLKNLSVSAGALGDTNQFAAGSQGTEGTGSVNLRNLGRQRTLVLLNGRRLVNAPQSGSPDTNLIPLAAVGRIEVLKDGAAATYGSDAIAGVVNFITNDRLDGLEIGGSYKYIEDTDGDYDTKLSYGWQGDNSSLIAAAGYQHRSELRVTDRDFALTPFTQNPQSYSSGGNPGTFNFVNPLSAARSISARDPGCAVLGSVPGVTDTNAPACYLNFPAFDNLVEEQNQYQVYAEYNLGLGAASKLHVEGFYSRTEIPEYRTSPSFLPNQTPTLGAGLGNSPIAGRFVIPTNNPGFRDLFAQNPNFLQNLPAFAALPANERAAIINMANTVGIVNLNPLFRPFGVGGNPQNGQTNISDRTADAFRLSASIKGDIGTALGWDVGVTYMENVYDLTANDIPVTRLQAALKGFGGFNCTGTTPGANGCLFYNPYSSAIQRNVITGDVNPNFVPTSANTPELAAYLFGNNDIDRRATQIVVDAVFNGATGWSLPGGDIGWAAGAQYRQEDFFSRFSELGNYGINPCTNPGDRSCLTGADGKVDQSLASGIFLFQGGGFDVDVQQNVYAFFGELSLPILDAVQAQVAARFEDYGGAVGDTFDPKLSLRWQATDWLALRGSIGTSFRGPPANQLTPNSTTVRQFLQQANGFRAVRVFGNPDLKPESATTFNLGALFNLGGFRASLDYFNYDFEDQIVPEDFSAIVAEVFSSGAANCNSPVARRIVFNNNAACAPGALASTVNAVVVNTINGTGIKVDGVDLDAEYTFNGVLGGALTLGVNASYVLNFDVGALLVEGVQVSPSFDGVGFSNVNTGYTPLPPLKGSFFVDYARGIHNLRWITRYTDSYIDTRSTLEQQRNIFAPRASTGGVAFTKGRHIDAYVVQDLTYVAQLPQQIVLSASISNLTDEDPSFTRNELSYDPTTGSPIGRAIEFGLRKKF